MSEQPLPADLAVALKEWDVVCRALMEGRQMVLLRKGGIYESGGEFELEHRQFLLFPTFLHQDARMLKASEQSALNVLSAEPSQVQISAAAAVSDILPVTSRAALETIDDEHVWAGPLIDMRFNYKPANPLYLMLIRAFRLPRPQTLQNTPAYAGCKSWVPLEQSVSTDGALPILDESRYQERRRSILDRLRSK
jgi:hypothetical protein